MRPLPVACCLAIALSARLAAGQVQDIIIESRSQGQNHSFYKEVQGTWIDSQTPPSVTKSMASGLTSGKICGTRKIVIHSLDEPTKMATDAAVRFFPHVKSRGRYHAYITWPTSANISPVFMTVKHATGEESFQIWQLGRTDAGGIGNSNKWVALGEYEFKPGEENYVEMRIGKGAHSASRNFRAQVVADAMRFRSEPLNENVVSREQAVPELPTFPWVESLEAARKEAVKDNKKILLYFALAGSGVSRQLEEMVFAIDAARLKMLKQYVPVRLNYAQNTKLAASLGVFRGGVVVVYEANGKALGRIDEASSTEDFLRRLDEISGIPEKAVP